MAALVGRPTSTRTVGHAARFLTEDDSWQQRYFRPEEPEARERLLYSSQVQDNVS